MEATALPTESQPLPKNKIFVLMPERTLKYNVSIFSGKNSITFETLNRYQLKQALSLWDGLSHDSHYQIIPLMTENPKRPPPFNLTIYKGQKNVILSRTFAKWAFNLSHLINTVLICFALRFPCTHFSHQIRPSFWSFVSITVCHITILKKVIDFKWLQFFLFSKLT